VIEHSPPLRQQRPGCGQMFGEQDPPNDQTPVHASAVVMVQAPSLRQHLDAGGQGLGLQTEEPPMNVPVQADCSLTTHAPVVVLQHLPGWGQGGAVQTPADQSESHSDCRT
jgi:hypothetical protein